MFPVEIQTDRLRLRRATREEIPSLTCYEHCREGAADIEDAARYVPWDPHASPKESRDLLVRCEERWDDGEAAAYVVRPGEGEDGVGEFAGMASMYFRWDRDTCVFGTWLAKRFWGRGYSGERARAFFEVAFEELDVSLCAVEHLPGNENSERAVRRYVEAAGGRREGEFRHRVERDGEPASSVRYSVSQAEWHDAVGERTATLRWEDAAGDDAVARDATGGGAAKRAGTGGDDAEE